MCDLKQDIPEVLLCAAGKAEGGESGADKGRGPRIYVGGIPTAVSETMVRNHFSQWGQVTTKVSSNAKGRGLFEPHLHEPRLQLVMPALPSRYEPIDYTLILIQQYTRIDSRVLHTAGGGLLLSQG